MRTSTTRAAIAVGFALLGVSVAARGDVILDASGPGGQSVGYVYAYDGTNSATPVSLSITSFATTGPESTLNPQPPLFSTVTYSLSGTGFSIAANQARTGGYVAQASTNGQIYFTANDNTTTFALTGTFNYSNPRAFLSLELDDLTHSANDVAYQDVIGNDTSTAPGSFVVPSTFSGSLNSTDQYEFKWDAFIQAYPLSDNGATANGTFGISFTDSADPATAPLPSTAYAGLALLVASGCWMLVRRRKVYSPVTSR